MSKSAGNIPISEEDNANDPNIQDSISRIDESLLEQFTVAKTLGEKKNFLLSLEISSFVQSTLQFMTDIIYLLYYLSYYEDSSDTRNLFGNTTNAKTLEDQLAAVRVQLCELIIELKTSYHDLTKEQGSELSITNSAPKYRNIVDKNLVRLLTTIIQIVFAEIKTIDNKLAMILHNCMLGFVNIHDFLKKIPLQTQYRLTKAQVGILLKVLGRELIPSWKLQLDKLNVAIFEHLAKTDPVIKKYREATGATDKDFVSDKAFAPYVDWLKDEIIRDMQLSEH